MSLEPLGIHLAIAQASSARWELLFDHRGYRVYFDAGRLELGPPVRARLRYEFPFTVPASAEWPAHQSSIEVRRFDFDALSSGAELAAIYPKRRLRGDPIQSIVVRDVRMEQPAAGTMGAAVIDALRARTSARPDVQQPRRDRQDRDEGERPA